MLRSLSFLQLFLRLQLPTAYFSAASAHGLVSGNFRLSAIFVSLMSLIRTFSFIANFEYFLRILNASPGHLRDVKQSVYSAKVDERAEICNILNSSFYYYRQPEFSRTVLSASLLSLQPEAVLLSPMIRSSSRIELADNELNLLILHICSRSFS